MKPKKSTGKPPKVKGKALKGVKSQPNTPLKIADKKKKEGDEANKTRKTKEKSHSAPISGDELSKFKSKVSGELVNKFKKVSQDALQGKKPEIPNVGLLGKAIMDKGIKQTSSKDTSSGTESVSSSSTNSSKIGALIKKEGDKFLKSQHLKNAVTDGLTKLKSTEQAGKLLPKNMLQSMRNTKSTTDTSQSDESTPSQPKKNNKKRREVKSKRNKKQSQSDRTSDETSDPSCSSSTTISSCNLTSESNLTESETTEEKQIQMYSSEEQHGQETSSSTELETSNSTSTTTTPSSEPKERQQSTKPVTTPIKVEEKSERPKRSRAKKGAVRDKKSAPRKQTDSRKAVSIPNRLKLFKENRKAASISPSKPKAASTVEKDTSTNGKENPDAIPMNQEPDQTTSLPNSETPLKEVSQVNETTNVEFKASEIIEKDENEKKKEEKVDDPETNLMMFKLAKNMLKDKQTGKSKEESHDENQALDSPPKEGKADWLTALDLITKAQAGVNLCECSKRRRSKHGRTRVYCQPYWPCFYRYKNNQVEQSEKDQTAVEVKNAIEPKGGGTELVIPTSSKPIPPFNMIGPCPMMGICVSSYSESSTSTSSSIDSAYLKREEANYLCNVIKVLNGYKLPRRKRRSHSLTYNLPETVGASNPCYCTPVPIVPIVNCSENQSKVSSYPAFPVCLPAPSGPRLALLSPMNVSTSSITPNTMQSSTVNFVYR